MHIDAVMAQSPVGQTTAPAADVTWLDEVKPSGTCSQRVITARTRPSSRLRVDATASSVSHDVFPVEQVAARA
jgi:hypothetical protein